MSIIAWLIIGWAITLILGFYFIRKLILRNERYEHIAIASHNENENLWAFVIKFKIRVNEAYDQMIIIDRRGAFQTDDEVEMVFKELKAVVTDINGYLNDKISDQESKN